MTMRTTVQRTSGGVNEDGQPIVSWSTHISNLPCYVWSAARTEAVTEDRIAVVGDIRAIVPTRTDITELDRLSGVRERNGVEYMPGLFEIRGVERMRDHKELLLVQVGTP